MFVLPAVNVVAASAFAAQERLMNILLRKRRLQIIVAIQTHVALPLQQQTCAIRAVRIMTAPTFPHGDRRVRHRLLSRQLDVFMAL